MPKWMLTSYGDTGHLCLTALSTSNQSITASPTLTTARYPGLVPELLTVDFPPLHNPGLQSLDLSHNYNMLYVLLVKDPILTCHSH